jgi:opacity protein-like surface antigen
MPKEGVVVRKNVVRRTLVGLGLLLVSLPAFADVGMVGESHSTAEQALASRDVGMIGDDSLASVDESTGGGDRRFFVHVGGGVFYRNLRSDSGLFCLNTSAASFGTACSTSQTWRRAKQGATWSAGIGFRYNAAFALDFAYRGLQKQSTTAVTGASNLALRSWLVTGLYQAQVQLFPGFFLMPQVGVAYIVGRTQGSNNGTAVNTTTVNWRPAVGLGLLAELNSRFALNLSGVYVPGSGNSPTLGLTYPSIQMVTLGLRYAF